MLKKKHTIHVYGQRTIHLSLPVSADKLLSDYMKRNGCQSPVAIAIAIDRYDRLPEKPTPATLEKCGQTRTDGEPCRRCRMPGQATCSHHGAAYVRRTIRLPLELQSKVDQWTAEGAKVGATVNLVIALAIMTTMDDAITKERVRFVKMLGKKMNE